MAMVVHVVGEPASRIYLRARGPERLCGRTMADHAQGTRSAGVVVVGLRGGDFGEPVGISYLRNGLERCSALAGERDGLGANTLFSLGTFLAYARPLLGFRPLANPRTQPSGPWILARESILERLKHPPCLLLSVFCGVVCAADLMDLEKSNKTPQRDRGFALG